MAKWINRTLVQAARNGTTSHTVSFTAATAGNLLVAVAEGPVTSTTPTGWTLPSGGSAISNTGLYVWYKTASSGESSFSTTHNGSNYPCGYVVYEFPAGSTFVSSVSDNSLDSVTGPNPNLTGLTGTNLTYGVVGVDYGSMNVYVSAAWTATAGSPVEDVDVSEAYTSNDGYGLTLCYIESNTASNFLPTANVSQTGSPQSKEALTFAVAVASGTLTVSPSGIASAEAFGTAAISTSLTASPAGLASGEAFGTATVTKTLTVSPAGTGTAEAFGTAAVTTSLTASPAGIASSEAFGAPSLTTVLAVAPAGIASGEALGTATVAASLTVSPNGVISGETFGTPTVTASSGNVTVSPAGIASAEALGTLTISATLELDPAGIASGEAFGTPTVVPAGITVTPAGIPSAAALGTPVLHYVTTVSPQGIASGEAFGAAVLSGALALSYRVAAGRLPGRRYQASITSKR